MYQQNQENSSKQDKSSNRRVIIKEVYNVVEHEGLERPMWVRVGTAFVNRDDSLSVKLDLWPANSKLVIRDRRERETTY